MDVVSQIWAFSPCLFQNGKDGELTFAESSVTIPELVNSAGRPDLKRPIAFFFRQLSCAFAGSDTRQDRISLQKDTTRKKKSE